MMSGEFKGEAVEFRNHPGLESPYCPFCGKKLLFLFNGKGSPVAFGLDLFTYCKVCDELWLKKGICFALQQMSKKEWGFKRGKEEA